MLFNSLSFVIFLPVVFLLYWFVFKSLRWQNVLVLVSSYVFYGWWDWRFLILIFFTTVCSWGSGLIIGRLLSKHKKAKAKSVCALNLTLNFSILAYFKYFNFFADNLKLLFSQFGFQLDWFTLDVLLPVGISFYTFQALSYTIDVYRHDIKPTSDFVAFASFIAFFPQLVAGPIERSTNLLPQFLHPRTFDSVQAVSGMRQILWGFFKKMVIADNCAGFANTIFEGSTELSGSTILLGGLFFTFQIYGDFSGYSDIAIGTAKLFGIKLMKNFNLPYFSQGISEFWRRWHISLNKWFIDYVYIPLGGNRKGRLITLRNLMIVFALSGLWHGADWTFVLWGVYNGILLCLSNIFFHNTKRIVGNNFKLTPTSAIKMVLTFGLVVIGWILFRADNLEMADICLSKVFSSELLSAVDMGVFGGSMAILISTVAMIAVMITVEYRTRHYDFGLDIVFIRSKAMRWSVYLTLLIIIMLFTGEQEKFIYFQF